MTDWRYIEGRADSAFVERLLQLEEVRPEVTKEILHLFNKYLPEDEDENGSFSGYVGQGMFWEEERRNADSWYKANID